MQVSSSLSTAEEDSELLTSPNFTLAEIGLPHKLLMSHNAAFDCLHGRMLVAYGGMAHTSDQNDWQGNDVGIVRAVADATHGLKLHWSLPQLAVSGEDSTGARITTLAIHHQPPSSRGPLHPPLHLLQN